MLAILSTFFELGSTRQHGAGMNKKLSAAFVECRPATGLAHEERTGELPFEILDMAADGGLRDAELPGGRRETACFRNSDKNLEPPQRWIQHLPPIA